MKEYAVTSSEADAYNCIAFAAGDTTRWWEPLLEPGYYWPSGAYGENNYSVAALKRCFAEIGFEECSNGILEEGCTKVALYAIDADDYEHAALQEANGEWSSKLGRGFDIRHKTAECVCGPKYGQIMAFMKRKNAE